MKLLIGLEIISDTYNRGHILAIFDILPSFFYHK